MLRSLDGIPMAKFVLMRLNLYSKIFLGNFSFHRVQAQYSDYFATFYGPLIFVFASFSVVLCAMQVHMAIESIDTTAQWRAYWQVCQWCSVICLFACFNHTLTGLRASGRVNKRMPTPNIDEDQFFSCSGTNASHSCRVLALSPYSLSFPQRKTSA